MYRITYFCIVLLGCCVCSTPSLALSNGERASKLASSLSVRGGQIAYFKAGQQGSLGTGLFIWEPGSKRQPDGVMVLAEPGLSEGRWLRDLSGAEAFDAQWCGLPGDSETNASPALQKAIDFASKLRLPLVLPDRAFTLHKALAIPSQFHLIGSHNTELIASPMNKGKTLLLTINNTEDVIIERIRFNGNKDALEGFTNVVIVYKSSQVRFEDCHFFDTRGIALLFSTAISHSGVINSSFYDCGTVNRKTGNRADRRQAIAFCCGEMEDNLNNYVIQSRFHNVGLDCISLSSQKWGRILNNTFISNDAGTIYLTRCDGVIVHGNIIANGPQGGNAVDTINNQNLIISNNLVSDAGASGVLVAGEESKVIVNGNIIRNHNNNQATQHRGAFTMDTHKGTHISDVIVSSNYLNPNPGNTKTGALYLFGQPGYLSDIDLSGNLTDDNVQETSDAVKSFMKSPE